MEIVIYPNDIRVISGSNELMNRYLGFQLLFVWLCVYLDTFSISMSEIGMNVHV